MYYFYDQENEFYWRYESLDLEPKVGQKFETPYGVCRVTKVLKLEEDVHIQLRMPESKASV